LKEWVVGVATSDRGRGVHSSSFVVK